MIFFQNLKIRDEVIKKDSALYQIKCKNIHNKNYLPFNKIFNNVMGTKTQFYKSGGKKLFYKHRLARELTLYAIKINNKQ